MKSVKDEKRVGRPILHRNPEKDIFSNLIIPFDMPRKRSAIGLRTPAARRKAARAARGQSSRTLENPQQSQARLQSDQLRHRVQRASVAPQQSQTRQEADRLRHFRQRASTWADMLNAAFHYNPALNYEQFTFLQIGHMDKQCLHCTAFKYNGERPGMCCSAGKVRIPDLPEPPEALRTLLDGSSPHSAEFMQRVRHYNNAFQMTSFGCGSRVVFPGYMPTFKRDNFAKTLLYVEVPVYYIWSASKSWQPRKQGTRIPDQVAFASDSIGRVYTVHPNFEECFYLRMLLHSVRGPTSFAALRTINVVLCQSYKEACLHLGLLENDQQWHRCIQEAVLSESPLKIRVDRIKMEINPGASKTKGNNKPREKKLATSGKRLTTNEATRHTLATVILELTAALQGARSTQLETVFRSATLGATDARIAGTCPNNLTPTEESPPAMPYPYTRKQSTRHGPSVPTTRSTRMEAVQMTRFPFQLRGQCKRSRSGPTDIPSQPLQAEDATVETFRD
ncbi:hypothetical protein LAZ67_3004502 [Cordylochernes scorpioides]|uniref:Helitron helicase-like domain-containing protein n=1 Tax=Cordylochernes scorpioides TaxID=51811 RepID=A0ABY6K9E8_9ARAC|nr:hypothetical protein LAZ67_3004502 [Cordylochernes scorpioides]